MNRNKKKKSKRQIIRVWTFAQARQALPYITSIMRSLREHWLEAQRHLLREKRLGEKPGRPNRADLLAKENSIREAEVARDKFNEAFEELEHIEVYAIDPNQGLAALPFVQDDRLAWLIYDLFAPDEFQAWRFHDDPLETRRPIKEITEGTADNMVIV